MTIYRFITQSTLSEPAAGMHMSNARALGFNDLRRPASARRCRSPRFRPIVMRDRAARRRRKPLSRRELYRKEESMKVNWQGVIPALTTPFDDRDHVFDHGVDGLPCRIDNHRNRTKSGAKRISKSC